MRRLTQLAKRKILEGSDLVFDQTGIDISQLACDPVKTFTGKSVVTATQLKAICDISKPMAGGVTEASIAQEKITLAKNQMEGLPDSILETSSEKPVLIDQEENIYFDMSRTTTQVTAAAAAEAAAETIVADIISDSEAAAKEKAPHPLLQMHSDVGGRNATGSIYFKSYKNQLTFIDENYIKLPAAREDWDDLPGPKWDNVMFALGMSSVDDVYANPDLCLQKVKNKIQKESPGGRSIVHSTPVVTVGGRHQSFKGSNLSKVTHGRGWVDQTYTGGRGKTAFVDKARIYQLSPAAS